MRRRLVIKTTKGLKVTSIFDRARLVTNLRVSDSNYWEPAGIGNIRDPLVSQHDQGLCIVDNLTRVLTGGIMIYGLGPRG